MRASTLLSVIFLCGLCFSQENPSPNKHDEDARTQRGVSTQKPEQQSPQSVPVSSPSSQQGGDKHAQYEHPSEDKVYRVYVVDEPTSAWTKAYVFITAAIGVVGLFSIWILWRQTNIAQQSAQAALLSAQAVIHAERAWVMADLDFRPGSGLTKVTHADGIERTAAMVEVRVQNCGPTPAWIFEQFVCLRVDNFVVMSKTEYPSPQFPHVGDGKVSHASYSILPMVNGQEPAKWVADVWDEGWATEDNGRYVHIFGVVRYRDAFSLLRETYFGYGVWNGTLERMPSEAYNRHT